MTFILKRSARFPSSWVVSTTPGERLESNLAFFSQSVTLRTRPLTTDHRATHPQWAAERFPNSIPRWTYGPLF
jgi:hypothetical protein